MPPRPTVKSRDRPLSAIYIGSAPAPPPSTGSPSQHSGPSAAPSLPDLPEPPSPVSSVGSGLPSPPATNSTGSGSTGDPASVARRRQEAPMAQAQTGSSDSSSARSTSRLSWKHEDPDLDHPLDQDDDQTMRLKIAAGSSNESVLQRARSLAQRNRLQLDKLASGKLGRASPSSGSTSRNQRHSMPDPSQVLSGSETEREDDSVVFHSTSTTSSGSKSGRVRLSSAPTSPHRARVQQASSSGTTSPTRRRKRVSLAHISTSSFHANSDDENDNYEDRYEVGTARDRIQDRQEALRDDRPSSRAHTVNLNSLKTTPGSARRRSALPREFLEGSTDDTLATRVQHIINEPLPQTPYRATTASPLPATMTNDSHASTISNNSTLGRRSTLRGTRGLSDDYRHSPSYSSRDLPSRSHTLPLKNADTDPQSTVSPSAHTPNTVTPNTSATAKSNSGATNTDYDNSPTIHPRSNTIGRHTAARTRERRQTLRGGSAESALGSGRLVGEGLRAAGLSRRVGAGTFRERERERERTLSTTATEVRERERELDRMSVVSGGSSGNRSRRGELPTRAESRASASPDVFRGGERTVDWSPESTESLIKRRTQRRSALDSSEFGIGLGGSGSSSRTLPPRASTSMADYSYTSRTRRSRLISSVPHSDSEDDFDDERRDGEGDERDGGRRGLRAYKSAYGVREASLTRREQTLLERERELGRKERELDRERAGSVLGTRHRHTGSITATPSPTPTPYASRGERADRYSGSTRRTPGGSQSQHQQQPSLGGGHSHQASQGQSEHAKLMVDSLTMFESQLLRLTPVLGAAGTHHAEMLTRNAQTLVVNSERLNTMLKTGNSRALDAQIEAEVEGDYGPGSGSGSRESLVDVWRKIGGEYREGVRVSDDLVRAVTGLLLGVGRVMKEYVHLQHGGSQFGSEAGSVYGGGGTPRGSPVVHGRSISLGEEEMRIRSGGGGGAVSPDSRESRRSWEAGTSSGGGGGGGEWSAGGSSNASVSTGPGSREEALRRLAGVRPDSPLARASPAFHAVRELDRLETASPALNASGLGLPKVNIPGTNGPRRLFAPSQQREMALVAEHGQHQADHDPSPTPASRTRPFDRGGDLSVPTISTQHQYQHSPLQQVHEIPLERSRTLTLPSQPHGFETPLRRNMTGGGAAGDSADRATSSAARDRHERRKISIASIATIRGTTLNAGPSSTTSSSGVSVPIHHPSLSTLSTPSAATTAVTLENGVTSALSIARTASNTSGSSSLYASSTKPTFSRPEGISGLQQQLEGYRKRAETDAFPEGASAGSDASNSVAVGDSGGPVKGRNGISLMTPESERETRRKTLGAGSRVGARISLDGVSGGDRGGTPASGRAVVDLSVNAADRSAAFTIGGSALERKERRRTVTDIWPRS